MQTELFNKCYAYCTKQCTIFFVFFLKRRHCVEVFKVAGERKHFVRHLREKKRRESKQPSVYLMSKGVSFKTLRFMCWVSNSKEFLGY